MPAKGTTKGQRTLCTVDGCSSVCFGHGYCNKHYKRWKKHGDPLVVVQPKGVHDGCSFPDCTLPHQANGFCAPHNSQHSRGLSLVPVGTRRPRPPRPCCSRPKCSLPGFPYCSKHTARLAKFKRYGIDWEGFDLLWERCLGKCSICDKPLGLDSSDTHVDHCHESGSVRGILCRHCNQGLGQFRDDPERIRAAADYLERFNLLS
jgi:hypothetical protein